MSLFVDASVWSLAFRRDRDFEVPEVSALKQALEADRMIEITGLVFQELLQGFSGPSARREILDRFAGLGMLLPDKGDYVGAADLRNKCRRAGVQVGTIDALHAQLCIHHKLTMLTTNKDFATMAKHAPLSLWRAD